jgi:multiple sugar transport system ATP-binding protein
MIYVTHDQVEAMTMADKIAVLRLGRLEQFGAPLDLYNRPANLFVAGFIGSPKMNFITGQVDQGDRTLLHLDTGETLRLPDSGFAQRAGEKVTLGIRPNHMVVGEGPVAVQVRSVEQLGGESYVYGQTAAGAPITVHSPGQTRIAIGETIHVGAPEGEIHLFDSDTGLSLRDD